MKSPEKKAPELPDVDVERYWREGYLLLRGVFSEEEIGALRRDAFGVLEEQEASGRSQQSGELTRIAGDLLAKPSMRRLVVDERVLHVVRSLLGGRPVYFGDSNFQVGRGLRGWHKDNRLPDRFDHHAPDWQGRYTVLRMGVYLQDHAQHSGGLGIRAGSHEPSALVRALGRLPIARPRVEASTHYGKPVAIDSRVGDLVVWNLRTTHSGNVVRLRPLPGRKVGTWVENLAPRWLRLPEEERRVAIFLTYGVEGEHLERYVDYLRERGYLEATWRELREEAEGLATAAERGLEVLLPPTP
jgi:hypothetical protein